MKKLSTTRPHGLRLPVALGLIVCAHLAAPAALLAQPAPTGPAIAIRELTLKRAADTAAFDRFIRETYNPSLMQLIPGMQIVVMQADRGARKGHYALIFTFDSTDRRNAYFPQEGSDGSEAWNAYIKEVRDLDEQLMQYVERIGDYTDYVVPR